MKVSAKVNPVLVTLAWEKPDYPIAGYIVEKRSKTSDRWARRNAGLLKPRIYKDRLKPGTYGVFYYRVTAVGFDGRRSKPCRSGKIGDLLVQDRLSQHQRPGRGAF